MKVLIMPNFEYMNLDPIAPEVGRTYILEDATKGTNAQKRLFHLLLKEYFYSGLYSYAARSLDDLKTEIKKSLGVGFHKYIYGEIKNNSVVLHEVKDKNEIPIEHINECYGILKSLSEYTMKELVSLNRALIIEMINHGVKSKTFDDIAANAFN